MNKYTKIFLAGNRGMVGSAIQRCLFQNGYLNIVTRTHEELDLTVSNKVESFFQKEKFDCVILAAARVGGIMANCTAPAEFLYENLAIAINVIHSAHKSNVKKLLFLGSSCIYPRMCPQPMKEEYLLDGKLEPTNEGYALAKIVGLKMCQMYNQQYGTDFISAMPSNIYGAGDNFDPKNSHVVAALIRKLHEAQEAGLPSVEIWGTGNASRELLYVDDLADACIFLLENYSGNEFFNIGTGYDLTIRELAWELKELIGYDGEITFDITKPDGMPQKVLDVSKIHHFGWNHHIDLKEGLERTYRWFLENRGKINQEE